MNTHSVVFTDDPVFSLGSLAFVVGASQGSGAVLRLSRSARVIGLAARGTLSSTGRTSRLSEVSDKVASLEANGSRHYFTPRSLVPLVSLE